MSERKSPEKDNEELVDRIERTTEMPMLLLALAYLVCLILGYVPEASVEVREVARFAEYVIIALFAAELAVKLALARKKLAFLRSHWLDALIVFVPFFRPLRFVRFVPMLLKSLRALQRILGPYQGAYVLLVGTLSVFISALLATTFEQRADGGIHNFVDALWWAIETMTTVGYGDIVPVTTAGRAIGVYLMVVGIALFGVLTASVAAYFVGETEEAAQGPTNKELMSKLEELETQLEELEQSLKVLRRRDERR